MTEPTPNLRDRFPIFEHLGAVLRRPTMPVVYQSSAADCGAACLAMALGWFGGDPSLDAVRAKMDIGRDGASAAQILEAARRFELRGRGVRLDVEDLADVEPGAILHWSMSHFVVFEGACEKLGIRIVDPAIGRRLVEWREVRTAFSGVAILLEKSERFVALGDVRGPLGKPVHRFLRHVLEGTRIWPQILLASVLLQVFGLLLPFVNGRLVDRVVPRGDQHLLGVLVVGLAVLVTLQFVTSVLRNQLLLQLRTQLDAKLTLGFLDWMLRLPFAFYQRRHSADLLLRVNSIATVREMLTSSLLSGLIDATMVLGAFGLLVTISRPLALVALVLVAIEAGTFLALRKRTRDLASGGLAKQVESANHLQELLGGMESLKASGHELRGSQGWAKSYVESMNLELRRGSYASWSDGIFGTIRVAAPLVLLAIGILQVLGGQITLGTMLSATAFAHAVIEPMGNLVRTLSTLQVAGAYLARIDDVLSAAPEQDRTDLRTAPTLQGKIELRDVSFRYTPNGPLVLSNVNLRIPAGATVAIVGRSGGGKSTLASLLLGLFAPTSGTIFFDDQRTSDLDLPSLRRQFGVVVQRPWVFGTSIRANVALGDPALSLDRVIEASRLACLHDDVMAMPMGYDTPLVAGGGAISGGQRQRVALARALVNRPAILVLDEATSALDAATEARVYGNLARLPCTRVVIAHRLSTIVSADRIVVVDGGRIVAEGTHAELLGSSAAYRELVGAAALESIPRLTPPRSSEIRGIAPVARPGPVATIPAPESETLILSADAADVFLDEEEEPVTLAVAALERARRDAEITIVERTRVVQMRASS